MVFRGPSQVVVHSGVSLLAATMAAMVGAVGCARPPGPPSLVLISFDTLRADHLGAYGCEAGLTPHLDRFAAEAIVFEHAWAQANFTFGSHAAVFTGRYPSEVSRVRAEGVLSEDPPTLAGVLGTYGYETAAFTGGGMVDPSRGLGRGFDTFESSGPIRFGGFFTTMRPAWSWLEAHTGPGFLFIHGYDAHQPTLKPPPLGLAWATHASRGPERPSLRQLLRVHRIYGDWLLPDDDDLGLHTRLRPWGSASRAQLTAALDAGHAHALRIDEQDRALARAGYAGAVAYADAWFGWFMERMARSGRLEHTAIAVMSDHGESLGEDGRWGHEHALTEDTLHVPLLIRLPARAGRDASAGRVDAPVALFDIFPTLLELADALPPAGVPARSLVPLMEGRPGGRDTVLAEGAEAATALSTTDGRLVFSGVEPGSPWLPSLLAAAPLDGPAFEASDVADPDRRAALRSALLAMERDLRPLREGVTIDDPAALQALRDHGYWEPR